MKNRNLEAHDHWKTPKAFYDQLDAKYHFNDDPCPLNATEDGLKRIWGSRTFVNPPYSRGIKDRFVHKAIEEMKAGKLVVMLLPVSTSTVLFHEAILPSATSIEFIKGRIAFEGVNTKGEFVTTKKGMHDSMVVIFDGREPA